jgi:SAM-dependent methyltransferase
MTDKFDNWQEYWDKFLLNRYGKEEVQTEDDLFMQVARTFNRKPVEKEVFDIILLEIAATLKLSPTDVLVDFCCGNGLFTYELRDKVKQIIAVDFSQSIIDAAHKFKSADNITYCLGDVVSYMKTFTDTWPGVKPDKYLMNDSLAYFSSTDLEDMLKNIMTVSDQFEFLLRGVPNDKLKWNYYNTPERKLFYADLIAKGDLTNFGLGSWWNMEDIQHICKQLNLNILLKDQQPPVSDFRTDIVISTR